MYRLHELIWVVVGVVAVIVVGFVYVGIRSAREVKLANAVPARETGETVGWPSYRDTEKGIAFRYPDGWEAVVSKDEGQILVRPKTEAQKSGFEAMITISENPEGVTAVAFAQRTIAFDEALRTSARGYRWYVAEGNSGYEVFAQGSDGALRERIYFTKGNRAYTFVFPLASSDASTVDFIEHNRLVHLLLGTLELAPKV